MDLKTERGREIVRSLAGSVDVLVENFRPGTLEDWALDHATLSATNPGLIHLFISGFGQTGRYRDRPGYDLLARGMGGLMGLTGEPDGPPTKVGLPVDDFNGGTWGIVAVLMALQSRHRTGRGQYLDVSLLEAQMAWHTYAAGTGADGPPDGGHLPGHGISGEGVGHPTRADDAAAHPRPAHGRSPRGTGLRPAADRNAAPRRRCGRDGTVTAKGVAA